jgi:VIT1/CCC1 family predicted Fe2+/Mn2+ transporter
MTRTHAIIGKYLPDLIYGANDGLVTTLAIISGVVGASLSNRVILILGFANLLADGFSMGASNVLARRSESEAELAPLWVTTRHGIATFFGFLIAGFVPLIPYLAFPFTPGRFELAVVMALITLFIVGASRASFTRRSPFQAGMEMLLIGALAAGLAYLIGAAAAYLTDGTVQGTRTAAP